MIEKTILEKDSFDSIGMNFQYNFKNSTIFIVRGKSSYNSSGAKDFIESLLSIGNAVVISEYCDFNSNPNYEDLVKGLNLFKEKKAQVIIAIGGGSVIDMAKLIRFYYSYDMDNSGSTSVMNNPLVPLIAIPTTSGTGAETTSFAVLYKNQVKYSISHSDMVPDYAYIYPPLTYKNPAYLTACSGFDALAQAIESYWSLNATKESKFYASKAIMLILDNLPLVVKNPIDHQTKRIELSHGAYWAGKAINISKTTAPHAFSYPFTSYYGYPHGHAVALTFPYIAEYNFNNMNLDVRDDLLRILEINSPKDVKPYFLSYLQSIGLTPKRMVTVDENVILKNINLERLENNPCPINEEQAKQLIRKI